MTKKNISLLTGIAIVCLLLTIPTNSFGQAKKGGPPPWAPAHGYRANVKHVYFPEHNVYFDVQKAVYISASGSGWSVSVELPSLLKGINLSASTQIELDLNTDKPQQYNSEHKTKYKAQYKSNSGNGNSKPKSNPGKGNKK